MKAVSTLLIFVVFLIVAAVAIAAFFIIYSPPQIVGGPCAYDIFAGSCSVTSSSDGVVKFGFAPDEPMDLRNVSWVGSASDILTKEYSEQSSVIGSKCGAECAAGVALKCSVSIIKSGTCTPVIFKFS